MVARHRINKQRKALRNKRFLSRVRRDLDLDLNLIANKIAPL